MAWDEMDRRYGRKVGYWSTYVRDGETKTYETTAYLDREIEPDLYGGTNKHTDEPVTVEWVGDRYVEVQT